MTKEVLSSEYKNKLMSDIYSGEKPDRVPEKVGVNACAALELAGYDLRTAQYGVTKVLDATDKLNERFDTYNLIGTWPGTPWLSKFTGTRTNVMGSDGFIQHPDVHGMEDTEYDQFLSDPLKFIWEIVIPRIFTEFDAPPMKAALAMAKTIKASDDINGKMARGNAALIAKHNKATTPAFVGISRAPFDYFADYLRSFTGALVDMRRKPEQVLEAVNLITPLMIKCGCPRHVENPSRTTRIFFALHMPTYMSEKFFAKFWWPSFKETVWAIYNAGFGVNIFCEENWMHILDYLNELPPGCELQFEYGDPKIIRDTVGEKHIISGLYPVNLLKNGTKQEVCDKAKEYLDILAIDGKYIFNFDKSILRADQINWDNFQPLIDTIHQYGKL
ncbi:uroporphyrinogen decarboxylase [Alkalibaculum sp. M08DMB]|uniref:Uroporphyrinogen decarboxylase n=1 Tax=Alkalibaculum sporogenes TaxID=2655001 RepID=A0A6A7K553_9FIRM|nr:uroporphyrinogen decarboxylase family protein [Alkalibaculum sporogenes]MPW24464.1 uroporphyrinogen decarboxylase [Alkalibaculum sporogenes]